MQSCMFWRGFSSGLSHDSMWLGLARRPWTVKHLVVCQLWLGNGGYKAIVFDFQMLDYLSNHNVLLGILMASMTGTDSILGV